MARVHAVASGERFQQEGVVVHVACHGAAVVHGRVHTEYAGVWDEPVGGLEPHDAAPGRGHPDGTGLVATQGHARVAHGHGHGAPGRRAAGRVALLVRIDDRSVGAGMAPAREGKILAVGLADDLGARVKRPGDDGGVDVGHGALQERGAVHHRQAGHADGVLHGQGLAREPAAVLFPDRRLHEPGVVAVLGRPRPAPG